MQTLAGYGGPWVGAIAATVLDAAVSEAVSSVFASPGVAVAAEPSLLASFAPWIEIAAILAALRALSGSLVASLLAEMTAGLTLLAWV